MTNEERVLSRVAVHLESRCWEWLGCKAKTGYGNIRVNYKLHLTHRFAYETFVGPIPEGLVIDHLCRNRACCNPDHLEPVTNKVNILRGVSIQAQRARQTHCKNGHPLSGDNLKVNDKGHRTCRTCRRALDIARQPAKRQRQRERRKAAA